MTKTCPDCKAEVLSTSQPTELAPCPFCGREPELNILYEDDLNEEVIDGVVIRCAKCGISKEKLTPEAAADWWNNRAALAAPPAGSEHATRHNSPTNLRQALIDEAKLAATPAVGGEALSIVRSAKYANPDPDAADQQIWNDACEHIEAGLLAAALAATPALLEAEAHKRYPQEGGSHRQAFIEGAQWAATPAVGVEAVALSLRLASISRAVYRIRGWAKNEGPYPEFIKEAAIIERRIEQIALAQPASPLRERDSVLIKWQEELAAIEDMDAHGDLTEYGQHSLRMTRRFVDDLTASASPPEQPAALTKRPVAFRVLTGGLAEVVLFDDEGVASRYAESLGLEYQGLYVRNGPEQPAAAPVTDDANSYIRAVMAKRYGPPSSWAGKNPKGWHLERDCTPTDASMHDNGCIDAIRAIRAIQFPTAADKESQA